jgi:hypothetical protein
MESIVGRFFSSRKDSRAGNIMTLDIYREFWHWFSDQAYKMSEELIHKNDLALYEKRIEAKMHELGLFVGVIMERNDQSIEITFTTEGRIERILLVEEIVSAAPALKDWTFIAFIRFIVDFRGMHDGCAGRSIRYPGNRKRPA